MAAAGALNRLKDKVLGAIGGRSPTGSAAGRSTVSEAHAGTGGIAVSYAPKLDGDADPGEVVWTWVPYEDDPTQGKDRPVLILGWDGDRLAGVQLSSKDHGSRTDAHEWVPIGTGGWDRQARPSYVDAARLLRLDPAQVRREGAALLEDRFQEVLARVTTLHEWSP